MKRVDFDLDDLTNSALKRMVKQLLTASDADEKSILQKLEARAKRAPEKNDLADLDEEMHGKPDTPEVEDDGYDGELPDVPGKKKRKS